MARRKRDILTGIEIGSHTIKALMGEFLDDGVISVVGAAERPSMKVVKGDIVDARIVQDQLIQVLSDVEKSSRLDIGQVFLAVSGNSVRSVSSIGNTAIRADDRRIRDDDVITAVQNARSYALAPDKRVLHYLDRRYMVDGVREVPNPVGQVGGRLEADVQIVFGQHNTIETSCRTLADAIGYPAADVAFSGIAAGFGALAQADMEKGALVVDIGAGVTEYVLFFAPGVYHCGQIAVGCEHLVNDLSIGFRLPLPKCRKILVELTSFNASATMNPDGRSRLMEVESLGASPRRIPLSSIEQAIELRLRELFDVILADLRQAGCLSRISSAITLVGGGALIPGVDTLAQQVFNMPVQVGRPRLLNGNIEVLNSPRFVTAAGLLRWGRLSLDIAGSEPPVINQVRDDMGRLWELVRRAFRW